MKKLSILFSALVLSSPVAARDISGVVQSLTVTSTEVFVSTSAGLCYAQTNYGVPLPPVITGNSVPVLQKSKDNQIPVRIECMQVYHSTAGSDGFINVVVAYE